MSIDVLHPKPDHHKPLGRRALKEDHNDLQILVQGDVTTESSNSNMEIVGGPKPLKLRSK